MSVQSTSQQQCRRSRSGGGDAVYGLGFIGALIWYWQVSDGFWGHIGGIIEAILWPAFVVYDLLGLLAR
jgi:hypothetical protein